MFTGFPWNLSGMGWAFSAHTLQLAYWVGIYGLSALTLALAVLPAAYCQGYRRVAVAGACMGLLLFGGGALRVVFAPPPSFVEGVRLRLVQPNIPQNQKWARESATEHLRLLMEMSEDPQATHILWPEAAVPFPLGADPALERLLAGQMAPGQWLLTGGLRVEKEKLFNALLAINTAGIQAAYDKHHRVPFGEYIPLRGILPLDTLAHGLGDIDAGEGTRSLALSGTPPFSPLICYESIFSGEVTDGTARWLLVLTNDAWFGRSSGPYQHFALARVRAVEEGLPLVRVANTGISGVVDGYGRILATLPLGARDVLVTGLPTPVRD